MQNGSKWKVEVQTCRKYHATWRRPPSKRRRCHGWLQNGGNYCKYQASVCCFFLCLFGLDGFACFLSSWCCKALRVSWLHGFVCVHLFTATTATTVRKSQTQPTPKQIPQHLQLLVCSSSYTTTTTNNNNKATGWLPALVRVTNLKLRFSKLRDKMLVFVGLVKKCMQHGHSFRLAGVWLKFKKCISPARWINFDLRVLKKKSEFMIFKFPMQTSDHPSFFFTSRSIHQCQSAFGKVRPQTQTRRYYDAMSSCKPKTQEYVFFFGTLAFISCAA